MTSVICFPLTSDIATHQLYLADRASKYEKKEKGLYSQSFTATVLSPQTCVGLGVYAGKHNQSGEIPSEALSARSFDSSSNEGISSFKSESCSDTLLRKWHVCCNVINMKCHAT